MEIGQADAHGGAFSATEQFTTNASGQITGDLGSGTQTHAVYHHASYGMLVIDSDVQIVIA